MELDVPGYNKPIRIFDLSENDSYCAKNALLHCFKYKGGVTYEEAHAYLSQLDV